MGLKRLLIIAAAVLVLTGSLAAAQRKVLVIHSYDEELAWTAQCSQGIASILSPEFELRFLYLDTKRIPASAFQARADEAARACERFGPDLVMLGDDNALRLLGPKMAATGLPVVYFGINNNPRIYFEVLPDNVTGVIERIPLFPWIRLLKDILPDASRILVLMDDSPTADAITRNSFRGKPRIRFDDGIVERRSTGSWEEWQRIVLGAEAQDLIVMPVFHALTDESGGHVPYDRVVAWISRNSRVPVFATQDYAVGDNGVVGACVVQGEEHGRIAARIAKAILSGREVRDVSALGDQEGRLYFNRAQLKRFQITLPESIRNKSEFR
ncbi:MAG: ABC transporter substrate binding protein [Pseudodesulfovibrio sp.]